MTPSFRRILLPLVLLATSAFTVAAADATRTFDVPAGAAADTLKKFSDQAGVAVVFATDSTGRARTNALKGTYTTAEAIALLLRDSGLRAVPSEKTGTLTVTRDSGPNVPRAVPTPATARPETSLPAAEETLVLSPFSVTTARDTGYAASDSLAGTRLRASLRDIAASVSVVTKDFLDDTGAKKASELLVYTTGTEVADIGGNFSGSATDNGFQNFHGVRQGVNPTNRVRGLAAADLTRNYFGSGIPMDTYNTESVTINRGANAILFGLGSPAGIIETSTIMPQFRNRATVEGRFGSYDTHRQSLDLERVLLPGKLAVRVAALNDAQNYEQKPAFRDQRRYYGALEFRPFKQTTIRVNAEKGQVHQRLPHLDPPVDGLSSWWQFGKQVRADNLFNVPASRVAFETANNLNGPPGQWFAPIGFIFAQPGDITPSDAFPTFADGVTPAGTIQYRFLAPRDSRGVILNAQGLALGTGLVAKQITDRSVFDYRTQMIEGPNSWLKNNFRNLNIAVQQLFLDGQAGLEFVRDENWNNTSRKDLANAVQGYEITIDINRQTNDGRPNPNFGRPFAAMVGNFAYGKSEGFTNRATGFGKWDFTKRGFGPAWLRRLLGTHTLTGLYSDGEGNGFNVGGVPAALAPGFRNSVGATDLNNRNIPTVIYLGPSLANAASPGGAGIQGATTVKTLPSSYAVRTIVQGTNQWVQQTHSIYQYPQDTAYLATGVTATRTQVESQAFILQSSMASNLVVPTVGWRKDAVDVFNGNNNAAFLPDTGARSLVRPTLVQNLAAETETMSYGVALHVPSRWTERAPAAPRVSFYYNDSENFQTTGFRQSILGGAFDPQSGTSKEYGVGLSAFHGKLTFRATKYETVQDNISDARVAGTLAQVAELEKRIVESNTPAAIAAAGYVGFDHPSASALFKRYLALYNFQITGTQANGTRTAVYTSLTGAAEITSAVSKGYEFEVVFNPMPNWRILFNAAKQEAVRGALGTDLSLLINDRRPEWNKAAVKALQGGPIASTTVETQVGTTITGPYDRASLSVGQPTSELRKWRFNAVTNYDFTRDSFRGRLRGFNVGGAVRWQDKEAIGFPVINHPTLGLVEDPTRPFYGSTLMALDGWIGYRRKIFNDRIDWRVQLNVRNLLDDNQLVAVRANPIAVGELKRFEVGAYRIGERRTWEISSRFGF